MKSNIVVTCGREGADILSEEIKSLGYAVHGANRFDVSLSGSLNDCMRLNMFLRTAHRVLLQIGKGKASHPDQLYHVVKSIPWEKFLDPEGYICISSFVINQHIRDTRFANLKVKDAIADRMVLKTNKRPDSGPLKNKTVVFIHWVNQEVSVFFDTSGETIAKHNYRKIPLKAPLMESLASGIILNTNWDRQSQHFINPMCGSGTIAIEAALIALQISPGLSRKNFGFMHLKSYDEKDWNKIRVEAHKQIQTSFKGRIIASDIDKRAIDAARQNAIEAQVEEYIHFETCDYNRTGIPDGDGIVIFNPPYGERLGEVDSLISLYGKLGDFFKSKCQGKTGYIFTGNLDLAKKVGLRTNRRIPYYNAKIECRLLEYLLYAGSKKNIGA